MMSPDQIHIYIAKLDLPAYQTESLLKLLSPDEVERAGRFHFEKDQKRYINGRGMLRQILARYLDVDPGSIQFLYTDYSKPFIKSPSTQDSLEFNLSHSGEYVLYAITLNRKIGIDIEWVNREVDIDSIVDRFFSSTEIDSLGRISGIKRQEMFYQFWTRKEAFLKAIGMGVSFPLEQVDVSGQNGVAWSSVQVVDDGMGNLSWYGKDLSIVEKYNAAVVVEGGVCDVLYHDFSL